MKQILNIMLLCMAILVVSCEGNNPSTEDSNGVFSVSESQKVVFSQGNLQYHLTEQKWQFAKNQLDKIGRDNVYDNLSQNKVAWIDLFGWSGSTGAAKFGVSISDKDEDYSGDFVDWGINKIGNDVPNTWRTLTSKEWGYLFSKRPNAQNLFAYATINGMKGVILLPDNWSTPNGLTFIPSTTKDLFWVEEWQCYDTDNANCFYHNTYTLDQWGKMEQAGAIFFPTRDDWDDAGFWSSTPEGERSAYLFYYNRGALYPELDFDVNSRSNMFYVRLVKDL